MKTYFLTAVLLAPVALGLAIDTNSTMVASALFARTDHVFSCSLRKPEADNLPKECQGLTDKICQDRTVCAINLGKPDQAARYRVDEWNDCTRKLMQKFCNCTANRGDCKYERYDCKAAKGDPKDGKEAALRSECSVCAEKDLPEYYAKCLAVKNY